MKRTAYFADDFGSYVKYSTSRSPSDAFRSKSRNLCGIYVRRKTSF